VNSSYLSIHFTVPNFGELFVPADRFYWSYFRDFLYLYIDYTYPISLPVLFSAVLYLYIRCTRISVLPVPILAIFVPVHLLYRSYFSTASSTCTPVIQVLFFKSFVPVQILSHLAAMGTFFLPPATAPPDSGLPTSHARGRVNGTPP
jgi:hypothetical protein